MSNQLVRLLGVAALGFIMSCGGSTEPSNNGGGGGGGDGGGNSGDRCTGVANCVGIGDNFFSPASKTVTAGTVVTWMWNGLAPHDILFDDGTHAPQATASSGGSFTRTFTTAGTYPYHCTIHGTAMSGTIIVQ